jgi:hypothetical protein
MMRGVSQQPEYRSGIPKASRPAARRVVVIPAIVSFGTAAAISVYLACKWSSQLAVDSRYSAHTDGLQASVGLAWMLALLLLVGTIAAVVELMRSLRGPGSPP